MTDTSLPLHVAEMVRPSSAHELIFVADHLMDEAAMVKCCPSARPIAPASARNRALTFGREGASLLRQPGKTVHGVLFEIAAADLAALDAHLGLGRLRDRRSAYVVAADGRLAPALVYVARGERPGPAQPHTVLRIAELGRCLGFPRAYLDEIRSALGETIH
jgi:hypothetical protein